MNPKVAVGITIGVLAGLWTWASVSFGLITWVAFVSWALFFAAGGGAAAIVKVVPPAITGVIYGVIAIAATTAIGGPAALPVSVAVIAFFMCIQSLWVGLAMIPAAFAGAAALFGGAGNWLQVGIALILGALFGWLSEWSAGFLTRMRRPAARVIASPITMRKAA